MKPAKNSKADQAYNRGQYAALTGAKASDNPYVLGNVVGLKNWWAKGFNDALPMTGISTT